MSAASSSSSSGPAILSALQAANFPTPSPTFLTSLLSTQRATTPLAALVATTKIRLKNADFSAQPAALASCTPAFPADIGDPTVKERRLASNVPVQVLAVEDVSRSRWEQVEALEALERGEGVRGREVIRVVPDVESEGVGEATQRLPGGAAAASAASSTPAAPGLGVGRGGPHKLVLQDVKGGTVFAIELRPVEGVGLDMMIGTKMMLRDVRVARGVVLLVPEGTVVLGGKIDALHQAWVRGRKEELLTAVGPRG